VETGSAVPEKLSGDGVCGTRKVDEHTSNTLFCGLAPVGLMNHVILLVVRRVK
jgi:hypothetical protein